MLGKLGQTENGFAKVEFEDRYGLKCKIQQSSLASESCIWLGVVDPKPQVMCAEATKVGLTPASDSGWQPYHIPEQVLVTTNMHLTREQVAGLVERLNSWLLTGAFDKPALELVRHGKTLAEHESVLAATAVKYCKAVEAVAGVLACDEAAALPENVLDSLRETVAHVTERSK